VHETAGTARLIAAGLCPRLAITTGGEMLFHVALVLLSVWSLWAFGVYEAGEWLHFLLLAALFLMLLGVARQREEAMHPDEPKPPKK
jgi:hypothetical protein